MAMMSDFEHQYKILLIGDVKVGKSTFLTRYITNTVIQEPKPTLGVEYQVKSIILKDGTVVKLQIWDTSGSERYKAITTAHYRKSAGALLFYDITDRITFENLQEWLKEIKNNAEENTVVMLIGNKYDLVANNNSQRQVTTEEAIQFAQKYKLMFAETSAKTGHNLKDSLEALVEAVYEEQKKVQAKYERENSQTLKLKAEKTGSNISENQGGCCG